MSWLSDRLTRGLERTSQFHDPDEDRGIRNSAGAAGRFAYEGEAGFGATGREADQLRQDIQGRPMVSTEMLRQGLQQNQAGQMSMAASARPGAQPMAARTAMMNAGRAASGMSGQAATAGIQEQQARDAAISNMLMQQRQQELQAALGSRQSALQGYLGLEQARTSRYATDLGTPTAKENLLGSFNMAG
jgi:hypothetical protein